MSSDQPSGGRLRIHFTKADLAQVVVAASPDPMWETVLACQLLTQGVPTKSTHARWYRHARSSILVPRDALQMLHAIAPPVSYFPDFLTPAEPVRDLPTGLALLRTTPRERLAHDIGRAGRKRTLPDWAWRLADGDQHQLDELGRAIRLLHDTLVAPAWTTVRADAERDRGHRIWAMRTGGNEALLNSLRPSLVWDPPVLHADYPTMTDIHLDGRGLRLIPTHFCSRHPIALADPELPPTVVYGTAHSPAAAPKPTSAKREKTLSALVGRTRARILNTLAAAPATTGELAECLQLSPATISEHTTVLRNAGLVHSQRHGVNVVHLTTPLGTAVRTGEQHGNH